MTVLPAWIKPTWIFWVAAMMPSHSDTRSTVPPLRAGNPGRHQGRSHGVRPDLRSELVHRAERLQAAHEKTERDRREAVSEVEADNVAWLRSVVAEIGWPGRSMVGSDGADAALMLAQHTGRDHVFQRQCLDLLRRAAKAGEAAPAQVAYLTDRILLAEDISRNTGPNSSDATASGWRTGFVTRPPSMSGAQRCRSGRWPTTSHPSPPGTGRRSHLSSRVPNAGRPSKSGCPTWAMSRRSTVQPADGPSR